MKISPINRYTKGAGNRSMRCLSANLSPPKVIDIKEQTDASMSGIIPGWLHLCRASFRFIPAQQM